MRGLRRLRNLWRGDALAREFDDEIAFHFEQRIAANVARGLSRAEAEREARLHFGNVTRAREGMREARVAEWVPAFGRDVQVALRALRRQPLLAALAVLTLSLGIGANAAVVSLVDGTFWQPLPYPSADRLVSIVDTFQAGPPRTSPTVPELLDLRQSATSFASLAFVDTRDFQIGGGTEPVRVVGARAEVSLLQVFGVKPQLGRLFIAADAMPGAAGVAVLTDALWRANFGGDSTVLGRRIVLNGFPTEVVGVLPPDFEFDFVSRGTDPIGVYVPFPMVPTYTDRSQPFVNVRRVMAVGRLKPGISVDAADVETREIGNRIATAHQDVYRQGSDRRDAGLVMRVEALQETLFGGSRPTMRLMFAAVVLLLLIACVNMGQFLLARALERQAELALRSALGAVRGRLACQLAAESLVLAGVAGVCGLIIGAGLIHLLRAQVAVSDPFVASRIGVTGTVLAATVAMAGVVTLLCNLVPVMRLARSMPLHSLATRQASPRTGVRHVLIAAQVAVTVTLLGAAGLLVHSLTRFTTGDPGYVAKGVETVRLRAPLRTPSGAVGPLYRQYLERLRAVPDIVDVAMASMYLPLFPGTSFAVVGEASDAATLSVQQSTYAMVSPDYFRTVRIPVRAGRVFTDADDANAQPVAVINEELARRYFSGRSPVGRQIRAGEGPRAAVMTIIGVVGDIRPALQLEPMAQVYVSYLQQPEPNMVLLVRSRSGPLPLAAMKQAVWSVQPDQPLFSARSLPDVVTTMAAEPRRSVAVLLGSVAGLAMIVSGAGLFTLVTYVTTRRRREIALRRVIGAGVLDVIRALSAPTFRWTCGGLALGVVGASSAAGLLRATYAGVVPTGPWLMALICVVYVALAAVALCAPAFAACRSDPGAILRAE